MQRRLLMKSGAAALLAAGVLSASGVRADTPLRIIVPYAPGGPIDATVRALAERVRDTLGPVIVENRPGAGGNIGVEALARSAPDGLTLGIAATATHAVNPWLYRKLPFNVEKDFAPVTQIVRVPNVLVINAQTADRLHIQTLQDLIAYGKAHPGKLNFGSGGNGSAGHLAGELFKAQAGLFAVHIPYNGGNPAQLALLSGQVDFNFDNLATASANIKAGRIRALAVTTPGRSPALPQVPAVAETLKGFSVDTWWGLVAPAGTPRATIERLNEAFVTALRAPETQSRFATLMAEPVPGSPEAFGAFMKAELAKYEKVVKASGAQVD